jgi:inner membrane transporter RhtA
LCLWNYGNGFSNLTPTFLSLGVALALLSSAIPFTLEMKALGQLPARTFSILMSLEPAAASICALIFLQEHLAFNEIVAVVFCRGSFSWINTYHSITNLI